MQIKVTWPGNEAGEQIPLRAVESVRIRVSLVHAATGQAIRDPHSVVAEFDGQELPAVRREGSAVDYCVPAATGLRLFPDIVITVSPIAGGPSVQVRRRVIGRALDGAARAAVFFLALAVLYTFILVPNLDGALKFLSDKPTLPLLGAGTLLIGFWRDWWIRQLRHPFRPIAVALLAMGLLFALYRKRVLVLNRSLETLKLSNGGSIAPGAFMIIDEAALVPNSALCQTENKNCVRFGDQPDVGLVLNTLLLLRKISFGCLDADNRSTPIDAWRKAGGCPPKSGIRLERLAPHEALTGYADQGHADRITVQVNWLPPPPKGNQGRLDWTEAADLQVLALTPSNVSAGTMDIVFHGTSPEFRVETALDFGTTPRTGGSIRLLSPLRKGRGGLLESDVVVGQAVAGKLTSKIAPWPCPNPGVSPCPAPAATVSCWLADSGERLSRFLIRDELAQNSSLFETQSSELVSQIPVCWGFSDHSNRPDYGEIHLNGSWAPSNTWSLDLPVRIAPTRISILDQKGEYWGHANCPDPGNETLFHVGPIEIDAPRPELATLTASKKVRWSADATHASEHWAWLCWAGKAPPATLSGRGLWSLKNSEASDAKKGLLNAKGSERQYHATPGLRRCQLNVAGDDVAACKTKASPERAKSWFSAHGPADCHPDSVLCL